MKVVHTTAWDVQPGKVAEFMVNCHQAAEIQRRHGVEEIRLVQSFAGPLPVMTYAMIFPDGETFGKFMDNFPADPEWLALMAAASADPSAKIVSQSFGPDLMS
jgi:hypothetical protein